MNMTKAHVTVTLATIQNTNVETITAIINDAYRVGEEGILMDTKVNPFFRATQDEVLDMIVQGKMLVLKDASFNDDIIGCIKMDLLEDNIGEWGCLAVTAAKQGNGCGNMLVSAIEAHMQQTFGCNVAQLELLAPTNWKHEHKERLRLWYQRMGYETKVPGDYRASTQTFKEGTILGARFHLSADADFTTYQKHLGSV